MLYHLIMMSVKEEINFIIKAKVVVVVVVIGGGVGESKHLYFKL